MPLSSKMWEAFFRQKSEKVQRKTAQVLLKRFYKNVKTEQQATQTEL